MRYLAAAPSQTVSGNLSATATHTGSTTTFADGCAGGASAGIGIALGLNIAVDSTQATTERNIVAGGDVMFAAHASAASSAGAKASAAGAKDEGDTPDEKGVDKKVGAERGLADKKASETGTKGTTRRQRDAGRRDQQRGGERSGCGGCEHREFGGAGLHPGRWRDHLRRAFNGQHQQQHRRTAKANGTATGAGTANVGAAVAINLVSAKNQATIGENAKITAEWLTVEAKRTDVKGDTTGTIGAEAISGASGGKVGIAGSLALNLADSTNEALIKSGATVTLTGGDVKVVAEGSTASTVLATAKGSAVAPEEKVVAAGDTALITLDTKIGTAAGELNLTPAGRRYG